MKFGERLRKARQDKNLTQDTVAKHMIVSRQTISSWENEKTYPDITSLIKLSEYYDISLDLLLKEDNGMREYLRKKDLAKNILPISRLLIIMNTIFLIAIVLDSFKLIKLGIAIPFILVIGFINSIAMIRMDKLREKIGIERNKKIKDKIRKLPIYQKLNLIYYLKKHWIIYIVLFILVSVLGNYILSTGIGYDSSLLINIGSFISFLGMALLIFLLIILIANRKS
ncbi:helix-turn-helix domain-containing protein [Apilactobacillus micheneri]|uniref:Helix-turn-helix domain-containing protein n=1 Tax=Apilactobacillus micheneri TaxID=1899430 RepID=A0A9Q8MTT5_9LACO|nr:helix-turn-helix domain-containing protein [Apilactobacillus micheneri]TPR40070.1 helix-turn-helix domain-containing protein [Apilactobacillus micheneri]TPR41881.1 helix-turn-helix domain-containing protein [Apilactobacillus micheneri]TPR44272.1 helix-turn-helix domain-containing protein [Apilactobacillus micheneri]TPR45896.1 helix-turn-helix domain-containing protein [Apilactobacillus micheneri]TPR51657.1 helix-turn-helix domain-containing protein [Apilactobacillus micheneri]